MKQIKLVTYVYNILQLSVCEKETTRTPDEIKRKELSLL